MAVATDAVAAASVILPGIKATALVRALPGLILAADGNRLPL